MKIEYWTKDIGAIRFTIIKERFVSIGDQYLCEELMETIGGSPVFNNYNEAINGLKSAFRKHPKCFGKYLTTPEK